MKHSILLTLAFLALLAPLASAQQVLFEDSFETGLTAWTATGLWNQETSVDPCGSTFAPSPDGASVAWYGVDGSCSFDTGATTSGSLRMNAWIDLPAGVASISLRYWASSESEHCGNGYDQMSVRIEAENAPDAGFVDPFCPSLGQPITIHDVDWHERRIDLSAYRGARVRAAFVFDSVDELNNDGRGWLIDDVRVLVEPGVRVCPPTTFFSTCPCLPSWLAIAGGCRNSTGQSATLHSEGVPSLSADTLRFRAVLMPASTSVLLVQGTTAVAPTVFGDGLRCIAGTTTRLGVLTTTGGAASWPPVGASSISASGSITTAGSARYYFGYYRDVATYCSPAQFNVTDAQRVDWAP